MAKKRKAKKSKKPASPSKPSMPTTNVKALGFFGEVRTELKKVIWPTRDETVKLTLLIITVSIIVGAFIGGMDILLLRISGILF